MVRANTADLAARLGHALRRARIREELTQEELAVRADIGVSTVAALERGSGTLRSLVRALRALDRVDWIDALEPDDDVSPIQLLRDARRAKSADASRRRVRKKLH